MYHNDLNDDWQINLKFNDYINTKNYINKLYWNISSTEYLIFEIISHTVKLYSDDGKSIDKK